MKNEKLKIKNCRIIQLLFVTPAVVVCVSQARSWDDSTISEKQLRAHVEHLTSPELAGRAAPGLGSQKAQEYIASLYKEYGLK